MRVGIVGRRSWLAPHLWSEFIRRGHLDTAYVEKASVLAGDRHSLDALVLIAGRARPNSEDIEAEEALVRAACRFTDGRARIVYISSCAVDRWERGSRPLSRAGEEYVLAKKRCEAVVCAGPTGSRHGNNGFSLRLPVIFGAGQSLTSDMLVPSVARARLWQTALSLNQPLLPFELVHVSDAARAVVDLVEHHDPQPVWSVRSDPWQPLELVSIMSPGLPVHIAKGWEWAKVGRLEPGQRHVREQMYTLRREDLLATMTWYEQNGRQMLASEFGENFGLGGPDGSTPYLIGPGPTVIDV